MTKYRIVREDFFNEQGESLKILFFIQQRRSFLGITWWSYIKYKHIGPKTIGKIPAQFTSTTQAEDFIKNILKKNKKYRRWHQMVIKTDI